MSEPLVSILVPCRNAAPWLGRALRSAQDQTWPRVEIIVVDDGSTDASYKIAQDFASGSCLVVRQGRRGASAARNRALQFAQGGYIQYLDADDFLALDKVEAQLRSPDLSESTLTRGSALHFREDKRDVHLATPTGEPKRPAEFLIDLWSGHGPEEMVQTAQWLSPRRLIEEAGPWDESLSVDDDGEYFARVILRADQIVGAPHARSFYRKFGNGKNLSASGNLESSMRSAQMKSDYLLSRERSVKSAAAVRRLITLEVLKAYPKNSKLAEAGLEYLRARGLSMSDRLEGSPWFARLYPHLGWKAARRLQTGWAATRRIAAGLAANELRV